MPMTDENKIVILKLGGSIITRDNGDLNTTILSSIGDDLLHYGLPLIIVHGGGSVTKTLLQDNQVKEDFFELSEIQLVEKIRRSLHQLTSKAVDFFQALGLLTISVHANELFRSDKGVLRLQTSKLQILKRLLKQGVSPILCGDILEDERDKLYFCSGDQIVTCLAEALRPEMVLFLTNVDGVYSTYPPLSSTDRPLVTVDSHLLNHMIRDYQVGQGEMYDKLSEAIKSARHTKICRIINGSIKGNLINSLIQTTEVGTLVTNSR